MMKGGHGPTKQLYSTMHLVHPQFKSTSQYLILIVHHRTCSNAPLAHCNISLHSNHFTKADHTPFWSNLTKINTAQFGR